MGRLQCRIFLLCAWSFVATLGYNSVAAAGGIPAKKLKELKAASVYIKLQSVPLGGKGKPVPLTGSGFVIHVDGTTGYIATNNHVVSPLAGEVAKGNPQVVFHSGTGKEQVVEGRIMARDAVRDLAVIQVTGVKGLPKPIPVDAKTDVLETMPVYALGFPFGKALALGLRNPAITITRGTISSLRSNQRGELQLVQIDADINPGNSGGPIIDDKGRLVGVAVSKVVKARKIGFAVPLKPLVEMMDGKVSTMNFETLWVVKDHAEVSVEANLIDPLRKLQDVAFHYRFATDAKDLPQPDKNGVVPLLKNANQLWMKTHRDKAKGRFTLKGKGKDKLLIACQASYVTAAGKKIVSPVSLAAIDFTQAAYSETLRRTDPRDAKGNPRKTFSHKMKAGKHYIIDLRANPADLDPRVLVLDAGGKVLAEDDGLGGMFDALLVFSPPKDGVYHIIATANKGMGPFTLRVRADGGVNIGAKGLSRSDKLQSSDFNHKILRRPHRSFNLLLEKGKTYVVDAKSKEFDPYLRLENMADVHLKNEDLGGGGHSTLHFYPFQDGMYRLVVAAFDRKTGGFQLTVRETPGPKMHEVGPAGLKLTSMLNTRDPIDMVNHRASKFRCKVFPVKMKSGQKYTVDMTSKQFDPLLRLEDDRGKQLATDDDSGGNLQARLVFAPKKDGVYRIIATHFQSRFGAFELTVRAAK